MSNPPAAAEDFAVPDDTGRGKTKKAPNAFRTISEVADDLQIPQHVLRFWETKFPQVKPLKRGGGRRYYRPEDIALLRRISDLLYIQGYTIRGVQRMLREGGGKLADDIPPASGADRAVPGSADGADGTEEDEATAVPVEAASRGPTEREAALLALLRETLSELERIRALLP